MNSALKPALLQPGFPQAAGQSSPAKGNVATANHAVALPQGAQNTLHHGFNNLVGQDLVQHVIAPLPPSHAAPSMAPVSANMAQMAQNMSHHGNLSHVTLNSVTHVNIAARPSKSTTTTSAPLSLVQESKATTSQPLALTRIPEKKEPDSTGSANGTVESLESGSSTPVTLKLQNPEPKQKKQDIAITLSSIPKPPEKPVSTPSTPQKPELSNPVIQSDVTVQSQVATANEPPEKSPAKPIKLKLALSANVAPTRSDSKPLPELANENLSQEKPSTPQKEAESENAKVEPTKEEKKVEVVEKPVPIIKNIEVKPETKELEVSKKLVVEIVENVENKIKTPFKAEVTASKSTLKLAIVTPAIRKRRQVFENEPTLAKNTVEGDSNSYIRTKRNRTQVQLYQSPTPEIAISAKLSASAGCSTPTKQNDDKLIVFYKNEYLAVRNAEGGFYICQAVQNVYRTTRRIKIRWLSQDKSDSTGETYKPDFYDVTDMECVLTTLSLSRASGGAQLLRTAERERAQSILQRALRAERGDNCLSLTEEHPDGLDLSLYTDESQLEKKSRKRNGSKGSPSDASETAKEEATPIKKARTMPKRSPKSVRKAKSAPKTQKRKSLGSTPSVATSSKTATALSEKGKKTPLKQAKIETPAMTPSGRRLFKENKASSIVPEPSTSKGKTGRTRRIIK